MDKDWRLIRQITRNASRSAANKLVESYYKEMYAYIYKQTLDEELSLDLTQELFIHVLQSIHHYDKEKASFRTWLYKLASNRLIDYYRSKSYKQTRRMAPIDDIDIADDGDMTLALEYREDYEKAAALINELDAASQQVVRLKLFGEYTFQEIAAIEHMPESTVKTKYYAALRAIRRSMEESRHE